MDTSTISKGQFWAGWFLSGFVILFLLFDITLKLMRPPEVIETTVQELGYREHHIQIMAVILLLATLLYTIPKTAVWGAVLLTGYLGGAIATHLRVDHPLFSHTLFPVYVGLMSWIGLGLRDSRVRRML